MDTDALSVRIFSTASRVLLVFITYALLLVTTAGLVSISGPVGAPAAPASGSEPLHPLPIVALGSAGLITWVVLRSRWVGAKLAFGVAAAFFGAHTVLPELDALAAPGSFSRGVGGAAGAWFGGAVFAATFGTAAAVILGRTGRAEHAPPVQLQSARSLWVGSVKLAAAAVVQVIVHAGVGCQLGWYRVPDGFAFRGPLGLFCPDAASAGVAGDPASSAAALVRGIVWALVGLLLVRLLRRGPAETSLVVGLFFALAGPVHELLPCPLVPGAWAIGTHVALAVSQLSCGAVLALWLSWDGPSFVQPRRAAGEASSQSIDAAPRGRHDAGGMAG